MDSAVIGRIPLKGEGVPTPAMCGRCARQVPWYSLFGNLSLAIYKLIVGGLGGSAALVADALHSFADVVGSTGILVATKVSAKPLCVETMLCATRAGFAEQSLAQIRSERIVKLS